MVRMVDLVKKSGDGKSAPRNTPGPPKSQSGDSGGFSLSSAQAPAPPISTPRRRGVSLSGKNSGSTSLSLPTSLDSKTKYCPYLGGRKNRPRIIDYPAVSNVCYGKESREKKLLRTVILPFSLVPAPRQREFCPATYRRCPGYQAQEKEKAENGQ